MRDLYLILCYNLVIFLMDVDSNIIFKIMAMSPIVKITCRLVRGADQVFAFLFQEKIP